MRSWREKLLTLLGPGMCSGITFGDWLKLLRDNRFAIDPPFWPRAGVISAASLPNSFFRWYESRVYGPKVKAVTIKRPLFILGFWRSGTTHLHNLLSVDPRFAFPNLYQVYFPHTFLSTEAVFPKLGSIFLPKTRPQDNVSHGFQMPAEDEFATCIATFLSPYTSATFQRRERHYDQYLTFRGVSEDLISRWKAALVFFLKKLTWKYHRPLILKSPTHTGRIRLLLDLFPDARFIHIRRNPYAVFQSNKQGRLALRPYTRLQRYFVDQLDQVIIRRYRIMYDSFFEERKLIPAGQFHEVCFEELEREPMTQVRNVYEKLDLQPFKAVEGSLRDYVNLQSAYKKSQHPDLPPALRSEIAEAWRRNFEEWSYPIE